MVDELNHVYKLYGILIHKGATSKGGHYYCYIKNQTNDIWYEYDDEMVRKIGTSLKSVKKNINGAYILFYQKYRLEDHEN